MNLKATPTTAAAAGIFSALAWPMASARFGLADSGASVEFLVITLLLIALPAHAFVVGFGLREAPAPGRRLDTALLKRVGAWLAAALITVGLSWWLRG